MPTFRRLNGPPSELPDDDETEVPCAAHATGHYCFVHSSKLFKSGKWTIRQRNVFEVYWQRIQHFKFEYFGGCHYLGPCDEDTFFAFAEMINLRGLFWDRGHAWYIDA